MFIELHIIQNFPPSNLNRDDVGQPKETDFGGTRRARVSSQCLKRSIRYTGKDQKDKQSKSVFERYTQVPLADRTKLIVSALIKQLVEKRGYSEEQAKMLATAFAEAYAGGMKEGKTNVLLYLSEEEQNRIAEKLDNSKDALLAALSPQTPLQQIAQELSDKINQRAIQPTKTDGIAAKDLAKELQRRLAQQGHADKDVKDMTGKFRKNFSELKVSVKFFAKEEVDWTASQINQQWKAIEAALNAESPMTSIVDEIIKETQNRPSAPDIALFGRMLADKPETNIDAACQVAHGLSTHTVSRNEIDYFTAMDDLQPKEQSGAGFLDVQYFNSACFYRYARLDFAQLTKNLNGDADLACRTVEAFLRASEAAIPSGKKNSHAQECRPSFMLAVLRGKQSAGWSLANAFEKPVRANNEQGLIEQSIAALDKHFNQLHNFYDDDSVVSMAVALPSGAVSADSLGEELRGAVKPKLSAWINTICEPLKKGTSA
jgi:CRISPR system Cascade subunit CasC